MKKNYKIDIPEYLSIDRYQRLQNLEHLTELEKLIETVYVFTGIKKDEIKTWAIADLGKVTNDFSTKVDVTSQFYPIWQHNDVNYGYADISTMSLAEFIDLETLCKKPTENLHEIMAVLYRPITTHKFNKLSWKIKHNVKLFQEKLGNVFKYYELEKYDSKTRFVNAEVMKDLPAGFALGCLGFFFRGRQSTLDKFSELFKDTKNGEDDQAVGEANDGSFDTYWGWFATLYSLAKTNILSITGENSIVDLNLNFVLNYLAIDKDYKLLEAQAEKQRANKNRIRLK
jgi:hypothetical protein